MCSIAWAFRDGGYELRFNRDEKWTRAGSADPLLELDHPVPGACARDAEAGGTWLFTNEHGLTLAVMNAYPEGRMPAPGRYSRGGIPFAAASAKTMDKVETALEAYGCGAFAPFEAILIADCEIRRFCWDGDSYHSLPLPHRTFLTTSSVGGESVKVARNTRFDEISMSPLSVVLDDSFDDGNPASAIYVTRPDGGTVSQSAVNVTANRIAFSVQRRGMPLQEIHFPRKA